jgi:threonine dehydratase
VTIVMPRTTPTVKVLQTESVGGKVVLEGETFDEAYAHARSMERQLGLTFVHPFDDPLVAAGRGRSRSKCSRTCPISTCWPCRSAGAGF